MKAYPLEWPKEWPRSNQSEKSKFGQGDRPKVAKAAKYIYDQVRLMCGDESAETLVISTNIKPTLHGGVNEGGSIEDKGVSVYFIFNDQPSVIACDTFDRIGCNLWAIGKTIDAMRGIARWGGTPILNRAFTGFKALPQQGSVSNGKTCWQILGIPKAGATAATIKAAYRQTAKRLHPDAGGSSDKFDLLNRAVKDALVEINYNPQKKK